MSASPDEDPVVRWRREREERAGRINALLEQAGVMREDAVEQAKAGQFDVAAFTIGDSNAKVLQAIMVNLGMDDDAADST